MLIFCMNIFGKLQNDEAFCEGASLSIQPQMEYCRGPDAAGVATPKFGCEKVGGTKGEVIYFLKWRTRKGLKM